MGRKRRSGDEWLPVRVYRGRSAYEYRPKGGETITLCPLSSDRDTVLAAHRTATSEPPPDMFGGLLSAYLKSTQYLGLSPHTRKAYKRYGDQLRAVFGQMRSDQIAPVDVRQWLDVRSAAKSPVLANRELALLGSVYRWGYERGHCVVRPTMGVRRFSELPRDREVGDTELEAFAALCSPRMRAYLALRMASALRQGELLALPLSALRAVDAMPVDAPSKGGRRRVLEWTPALRAAADAVLALEPTARTYTWPARGGGRLTQHGFQSEWQRTMVRFIEKGGERFHEHDLRAAAVDSLDLDHAYRLLGHQNIRTTKRHYRRKPEIVKPAK